MRRASTVGPTGHGYPSLSHFPQSAVRDGSGSELFLDHPLFEVELAVVEQRRLGVPVLVDLDGDDVACLGEVCDGADRSLVGLERVDADLRMVTQQRAAPAPRAERRDRGQ